jgi:hypothetical protein
MSRQIEDISLFGDYKQLENRVTAAFLHICRNGGEPLIRFLSESLKMDIPESGIVIQSQVKGEGSVPDGLIRTDFSFQIYVESKTAPDAVDPKQLQNHLKVLKQPKDFLLYITPDMTRPASLGGLPNVYWINWQQLMDSLTDYLSASVSEGNQLLEYLIDQFQMLLDNAHLLTQQWNTQNDRVLIVAGSWAEPVALKYGYYLCQNERSFRPSRYISFFNNNQIRYLFEIQKEPEDNVILTSRPEFKQYLSYPGVSYNGEPYKVFTLTKQPVYQTLISNDKTDKNGQPCPYTYGQPRYSTYAKITTARVTSQL